MKFEMCKQCLCCDKVFIELFPSNCFLGEEDQRLIYKVFLHSDCNETYCIFHCNTLIDMSFLDKRLDFVYGVDIYSLHDDKRDEFFSLTKYSDVDLINHWEDIAICPHFLEHEVYDWNLKQ